MDYATTELRNGDLLFFFLTALIAAGSSLAVFVACFYWFRREQRRMQKRILKAISNVGRNPDDVFVTGHDSMACGELVAQFKDGKRVVSVLETDGRRYIHVNGELSAGERTKMVRYLKSEGFMS